MINISLGLLTWTGWGSMSSSPQIIARGWPNKVILRPESSCPGESPLVEVRLRANGHDITFFLFFVPSAANKGKFKKKKKSVKIKQQSYASLHLRAVLCDVE